MGRGWVGTKDPPPYFWVEKLKKRGIRVIRDSGRAQFQDLGPDLGSTSNSFKTCSWTATTASHCRVPSDWEAATFWG